MLARLFVMLAETGVRVCMVCVLVVVDWCVLVNPSLTGCKLVLDVVLVVWVVVKGIVLVSFEFCVCS